MPLRPFKDAEEPMQVDVGPGEYYPVSTAAFVVENPTLDLDAYAASYTGIARIKRLVFVANHCPSLAPDALRLAHVTVLVTCNTKAYAEVVALLEDACSKNREAGSAPKVDTAWIEATNKKAALKLEKLDNDLKNYKANSIKESIRRGHDDLGDHHVDCGDFNNALKCYSRARDYCTNSRHIVNMCLNVIRVSIYLGNWPHVLNYVNKAESSSELSESHDKPNVIATLTKLKCSAGLAELCSRKYKNAARHFLQASFDHAEFPEMLSPNNVAVYGGLCALATFDRQELQKKVIASSSFKQFLELEPQLRDVVQKFHNSQYASCLQILSNMKDTLLLDMYLSPHVANLYSQIRSKALVQYFSPYVSADMTKMATAFNTTVAQLEDELTKLILDGQISARIDSHSKTLFARDVDERTQTFERSLAMGKQYQQKLKALILRAAIVRNQIVVKPQQGRDEASAGSGVR
ncbi:COP9 signalosome complex subunit 1-like isoform X2 [Oscarella lobularis]|uniref:COP9 signalosome complex subunit 1-like isoform X2 n=1 Tax=Oscarella lobularis TaxID=121494 RepID=UPI0033136714